MAEPLSRAWVCTLHSSRQKGACGGDQLVSVSEEQNASGPTVTVLNLQCGINICQKQQELVYGELEIHTVWYTTSLMSRGRRMCRLCSYSCYWRCRKLSEPYWEVSFLLNRVTNTCSGLINILSLSWWEWLSVQSSYHSHWDQREMTSYQKPNRVMETCCMLCLMLLLNCECDADSEGTICLLPFNLSTHYLL